MTLVSKTALFTASRLKRAAIALAVAAALSPAPVMAAMKCATPEEAAAFNLRHLQSRLMLAGLACNQRDAYNNFVLRFRHELGVGGGHLISYFQQAGGTAALNRHVTEIANAAGLTRAENPQAFCTETWRVFWELEQAPHALADHAAASIMPGMIQPAACVAPSELPATVEASASSVNGILVPQPVSAPQNATAAPGNPGAAVQ